MKIRRNSDNPKFPIKWEKTVLIGINWASITGMTVSAALERYCERCKRRKIMRLEKCFVFGPTLKLPYVRPKKPWCKQEKSFFYIIEQLLTENMCAHRKNKETEKSAKVHKQKKS